MDTVSNNENIVFKYILENPMYYKYMDKSFFKNDDLNTLMLLVKKFYLKYNDVPSASQMAAIVKEKEIVMEESFLKTVYDIDIVNYDTQWIKETTEAWIEWKNLQKNLVDAFEIAKLTDVNAGNVRSVVQEIVNTIELSNSINFDVNMGLDFFNPISHKQNTGDRIPTGYVYVDRITGGGYDPKTLVAYVGASNIGKCVCGDTLINIKNKKTGEKRTISIGDFYRMCETNIQA